MNQIIVVDKPYGLTSSYVVKKLKKLFGAKKAGHSGTLDPLATGVLVVYFDDMTKLIPYVDENIKNYQVKILLGLETDTLDISGKITNLSKIKDYSIADFNKTISNFIGEYIYSPPIYSAIKVKGIPSYTYARDGVDVELPVKKSIIEKIKIIESGLSTLNLKVTSSKGTYIRALARDIGLSLGSYGTVSKLRRLSTGKFNINEANNYNSLIKGDRPTFINLKNIFLSVQIDSKIYSKLLNEKNYKKVDLTVFLEDFPNSERILLFKDDDPILIAVNKFNNLSSYISSEIKFFSKKN
tara:strand:+ start:44316 stop:45206 length:891 start_codon:yes stop_codon:yes gene_type:complete